MDKVELEKYSLMYIRKQFLRVQFGTHKEAVGGYPRFRYIRYNYLLQNLYHIHSMQIQCSHRLRSIELELQPQKQRRVAVSVNLGCLRKQIGFGSSPIAAIELKRSD